MKTLMAALIALSLLGAMAPANAQMAIVLDAVLGKRTPKQIIKDKKADRFWMDQNRQGH